MHFPSSTMQTFVGVCHAPNSSPVAGRIVFSESDLPQKKESRFLVVRSPRESAYRSAEDLAGIICLSETPNGSVSAEVSCPILTLPYLPDEADGKVALLDPSRATLYVSPDIGVFNRLVSRLSPAPKAKAKDPLILPNGKRLRLGTVISFEFSPPPTEAESMLIPPPSVFEEDALYEEYRDLAEGAIGIPLTATVACPRIQADRAMLHRQLRALLRSAVFGKFSLLIQGALTPRDSMEILREIREASDELKLEGREFNGSIPLGLLLDVPLLFSENDLSAFHFFCLDSDHLWDLITGYSPRADAEIFHAFSQAIRHSLSSHRIPCASVIANRISSISALSPLWREWEIADCFVPPALRSEAYGELSRILSKKEQH